MLWRRFREWREQRAVLAEVRRRQLREEAWLADVELNPLYLAKNALGSGAIEKAAAYWEQARALLPNLIVESHDSLWVLIGLRRYDEAEALMREGARRFPLDHFYSAGLAHIAEQRGDHAEALTRWDAARPGPPDDAEIPLHRGMCLRQLGQLDAADAQFDRATGIAPDQIFAWLERARLSDQRRDWPESVARWGKLADTFKFGPGFAGKARAMAELGQVREAEEYLERALPGNPADLEIAVARGFFAQRRGDIAAEIERWSIVRGLAPRFPLGYQQAVGTLTGAGRHAEADAVLLDAIRRFPDEAWPLLEFARLAHERHDWNEAISRWEAVRRRFPEQETGYSMAREALRQAGRGDEALLP